MDHTPASKAQHYEIRLKGHLAGRWQKNFESLDIRLAENGDTLLSGLVADQAALHGILKKLRDLGLPLISINSREPADKEVGEK